MIKLGSSALRSKYDFPADILDIIIHGKSTIDSSAVFQVDSLDEADRFIQSYGYNLENPIERAEVFGNYHEALNFIRRYFLFPDNPDGLRLEIPRKIVELSDIRELFLIAGVNYSNQNKDYSTQTLRYWACSLLKVMHTIAHIDKDLRSSYFSDIQKQIFDRFYRHIHRDGSEQLYLGEKDDDPCRIDLVAFETKPKKSRDSIILKLLHKPENVAEDIFDRVGIRFTTRTGLEALQIIKYLKEKMIVMPPNIKPSRSRNTLVWIDRYRARLGDLLGQIDRQEINETELIRELEQTEYPPLPNNANPHSSRFYRAIQFTCRQLIKLTNPIYDDLRELKNFTRSKSPENEDILKVIDRIDLKYIQREIRFFYPYEVQILDAKSAEENEKGRSAHSEYKRAQQLTAMRRVMGNLADAL